MDIPRTFPIRLAPLPGEALDSWLEALAHRMDTRYGDVLSDLGLTTTRIGRRNLDLPTDWTVALLDQEAARVAHATGVDQKLVQSMTLMRFHGRSVLIDLDTRQVNRKRLWGRGNGSRYCPDCLADSGGRWQLVWRLGWSFACLQHCRLLADLCPNCQRTPRQRLFSLEAQPTPGRCGTRPSRRVEPIRTSGCGHDLSTTHTLHLPRDHPALVAQHHLLHTIETDRADFGLYAQLPQPASVALSEIRAVAGRVLTNVTAFDLFAWAPEDILGANGASQHPDGATKHKMLIRPGFMAPPTAIRTAIAVTAALRILGQPSPPPAVSAMRQLIDSCRDSAEKTTATTITTWGRGTGPVLRSVQLAALGPSMRPSDQLRRRATSFPTRPRIDEQQLGHRARTLPSVFWPSWLVRLSPPGVYPRLLAPALATATLLVGSRLHLNAAATILGSATDGRVVSRMLQLLKDQQCWEAASVALVRLAEFLDACDVPIDYERRRRLDYSNLLPNSLWAELCRAVEYRPGGELRARVARCVLFHRISGLPIESAPGFADTEQAPFRSECERFGEARPPAVAHALDDVARDFLAAHGAGDEPVAWHPPLALLDDIDLPGPDPASIDIDRLHALVQGHRYSARLAADALDTSIEAVRIVLSEHPAPPVPLTKAQERAAGQSLRIARQLLPEHEFRCRYLEMRQNTRAIARDVGVSPGNVLRLARDYGIAMRKSGQHRRHEEIDRDWLFEQYVIRRRTLPDLAREKGMSSTTMARWARDLGIPVRPSGGRSHGAYLQRSLARDDDTGQGQPDGN
ncbi:TniQ family protein [Streptomyces hoynatensis]|nr:TniQ family protein [Streptomyces hoynatensis]